MMTSQAAAAQQLVAEGKDVRGLAQNIYFYKQLKYRLSVGEGQEQQANYKWHRRYLSRLKFLVLVTYIAIVPILETPQWCIKDLKE